MVARLRVREQKEQEMRAGMEKFMRSQIEKERLEELRKAREESASHRHTAPRLAHDDRPVFK